MKACNASGAMQMIKGYDELVETLTNLRDLDFGVVESWAIEKANKPRYKGCEPMKSGNKPVVCD